MLGYRNLGSSPKTYYGFTYLPGKTEPDYQAPGYINDPEFLYCGTEEDPRDFSHYPKFETVSSFLSIEVSEELTATFVFTITRGAVVVYFGDGEHILVEGSGVQSITHTYATGEYVVEFTPNVNTLWSPGGHDELSDVDVSIVNTSASASLVSNLSVETFTSKGDVDKFNAAAFGYVSTLESVQVPASASVVDDTAFVSCPALETISVAASNANYASIDGVLFSKNLDRLRVYPAAHGATYVVPEGTQSIHANAFNGCTALTTITIASSIIALGASAFNGCTSLASITVLAEDPPSIDATTLSGVSATCPIYVPSNSVDEYKAADVWSTRSEYIEAIS